MNSSQVLIIGAGACGLIAARELLRKGKSVTILEARSFSGGRIRTITDDTFPKPIDSGAEFIHGELPVTLSLLKEYKISFQPVEGIFWQTQTDSVKKKNNFIEAHHRELEKQLEALKHDITVDSFLDLKFAGEEYEELRSSVKGFVSGYDAADTSRASTFAFRDEWLNDDNEKQYRIPEGYGKMIDGITEECIKLGCNFHFSKLISRIEWKRNSVSAFTIDGKEFTGSKLIITIPVGVLNGQKEQVKFFPELELKQHALKKLGYGGVVKICMLFNNAFWKNERTINTVHHDLTKLGFVFSDAEIPTWWTHHPDETPLLTGWIGGKPAEKLAANGKEIIKEIAICSLAAIFILTYHDVESQLLSYRIFDWVNDPFSQGAYCYEVVDGTKLKEIMRQPEEDTLFFAGEGYHLGKNAGTVEAAFSEGFRVVRDIEKNG